MRILFVEDSMEVAKVLIEEFEERGWEVDHATTVARGNELIYDGHDVLVCDWELPDGFGSAVLRNVPLRSHMTTICFSGLDRTRELQATGITVDHTISKSDLPELLKLLEGLA